MRYLTAQLVGWLAGYDHIVETHTVALLRAQENTRHLTPLRQELERLQRALMRTDDLLKQHQEILRDEQVLQRLQANVAALTVGSELSLDAAQAQYHEKQQLRYE